MANSHLRRPAARSMGKPSVKGLSSSNRWSALAMLEVEEGDQDDWLRKLPDDIMLNIVERLDITDAARTSILSRRWRQIPAMLSKISLTVGSFDPEHDRSNLTCDDVVRANATVLETAKSLLRNRTISLHTIYLLFMQFFLGDGSINIGQTVADTIATQNVGSAELSLLTKKEGERCNDDDMLTYGMQLRSFVDACPNTFSGLTQLKLDNSRLGESDFPKNFSLSKRLEFLRLFNCEVGIQSLLEVEHQQLCELEIVKCDLERVDLNWLPNLTKLTVSGWTSDHDPLSFGYVPLLKTVTLSNTAVSWHKVLKLSELLDKATVSDLHLNFESEKVRGGYNLVDEAYNFPWLCEGPRELWPVFHKLRFVNLADISEECDLAWTLFILEGAPSLEELCLRVWDRCEMVWDEEDRKEFEFSEEKKDIGLEWEASVSDFKHHNLAVLRIFGFQLEDKFVDYVSSVMESAVNLKNIYLYERPLCEHKCEKRKDRYPWTKKQRISLINCFDMDTHPLLRIHFPSIRA